MTTENPTFFSHEDLAQELAMARRGLETCLDRIRNFTELVADEPWLHLEHLLGDLRAHATTVAVLERTIARMT